MNWDTIKLFLALHREGSARAVAVEYDLSPSTVTRRVTDLEKELGAKLFNRVSSGFLLTDSGQELLSVALRMEADAYEIERKLLAKNSFMQGGVRITVPYHLITMPIMDVIQGFLVKHPKVDIELIPSYKSFDLERGEADIALRIMLKDSMPPEKLIGTRLVEVYSAVYASKSYVETCDLEDPEKSSWIGWGEEASKPEWVLSSRYPNLPLRHSLADPLAQLHAVKAGMGISMLPCFLCDLEPDLVRIPEGVKWHSFDIWMLSHPDLRETVRFRELRQFLRDSFRSSSAVWTGDTYNNAS
ncbi:MAG: hypothetical protein COA42_01275 [Alteromonadaceae bacterium]|nr:MAG: hypothetical protein COA42_01275 [Alteromonadaceae bacterium]